MKKLFISVICLLAIASVNKVQAGGFNWDEGVDVSTVSFSSSTKVGFIGRGLIWGVGCSSSSVFSFWDIYDSSNIINLTAGNASAPERRIRISNFQNQYSTSSVASGDIWFEKPIKVLNGGTWLFSDQTANISRMYFTEAP